MVLPPALKEFNEKKLTALLNNEAEFTYRGKQYRRSKWKNGVIVYKRKNPSKKKTKKSSRKHSRKERR
jgi:hypothetical protein